MQAIPSSEQALQFALMLTSGMPSLEVMTYFADPDTLASPAALQTAHELWVRSKAIQDAVLAIQGKPWQNMSIEEKIKYAIEKHYGEMAYFLYSHNYAELVGADKAKADTCRQSLEAKLAGMAGKMDAMSRFYADVLSGKVKNVQMGSV